MPALHDASLTHAPRPVAWDAAAPLPASGRTVLMAPPAMPTTAAGVDLHRWGRRRLRFDTGRAAEQWAELRRTIEQLGVRVQMPAAVASADQTAIADAAIVHNGTALLARFANDARTPETDAVAPALAATGIEVITPPSGLVLEGGQVVLSELTLFGGWFEHREQLGLTWAARQLAVRLVALRLAADGLDRLDLCLASLRPEIALCVPQAFEPAEFKTLRQSISMLLAVPLDEAARGACSVVVLGRDVLVPAGCDRTAELLDTTGFRTHTVEVSEFASIGCGLAGLVLRAA